MEGSPSFSLDMAVTDVDWCQNCTKYKEELQQFKSQQSAGYQIIKEKIIQTDKLVKRYASKSQECEAQVKLCEETAGKLKVAENQCEILSAQLKEALDETQPFKKAKERAEKRLEASQKKVQELESRLAAFEASQQQTVIFQHRLEVQKLESDKIAKEAKELVKKSEVKLKSTETAKDKALEEMKHKSHELGQMRKKNNILANTNARLMEKNKDYANILIQHGLMSAKTHKLRLAATKFVVPMFNDAINSDCDTVEDMPSHVSESLPDKKQHAIGSDYTTAQATTANIHVKSQDVDSDIESLDLDDVFRDLGLLEDGDHGLPMLGPLSPAMSPLPPTPATTPQRLCQGEESDIGSVSTASEDGLAEQLQDALDELPQSCGRSSVFTSSPTLCATVQSSDDESEDELIGQDVPFQDFKPEKLEQAACTSSHEKVDTPVDVVDSDVQASEGLSKTKVQKVKRECEEDVLGDAQDDKLQSQNLTQENVKGPSIRSSNDNLVGKSNQSEDLYDESNRNKKNTEECETVIRTETEAFNVEIKEISAKVTKVFNVKSKSDQPKAEIIIKKEGSFKPAALKTLQDATFDENSQLLKSGGTYKSLKEEEVKKPTEECGNDIRTETEAFNVKTTEISATGIKVSNVESGSDQPVADIVKCEDESVKFTALKTSQDASSGDDSQLESGETYHSVEDVQEESTETVSNIVDRKSKKNSSEIFHRQSTEGFITSLITEGTINVQKNSFLPPDEPMRGTNELDSSDKLPEKVNKSQSLQVSTKSKQAMMKLRNMSVVDISEARPMLLPSKSSSVLRKRRATDGYGPYPSRKSPRHSIDSSSPIATSTLQDLSEINCVLREESSTEHIDECNVTGMDITGSGGAMSADDQSHSNHKDESNQNHDRKLSAIKCPKETKDIQLNSSFSFSDIEPVLSPLPVSPEKAAPKNKVSTNVQKVKSPNTEQPVLFTDVSKSFTCCEHLGIKDRVHVSSSHTSVAEKSVALSPKASLDGNPETRRRKARKKRGIQLKKEFEEKKIELIKSLPKSLEDAKPELVDTCNNTRSTDVKSNVHTTPQLVMQEQNFSCAKILEKREKKDIPQAMPAKITPQRRLSLKEKLDQVFPGYEFKNFVKASDKTNGKSSEKLISESSCALKGNGFEKKVDEEQTSTQKQCSLKVQGKCVEKKVDELQTRKQSSLKGNCFEKTVKTEEKTCTQNKSSSKLLSNISKGNKDESSGQIKCYTTEVKKKSISKKRSAVLQHAMQADSGRQAILITPVVVPEKKKRFSRSLPASPVIPAHITAKLARLKAESQHSNDSSIERSSKEPDLQQCKELQQNTSSMHTNEEGPPAVEISPASPPLSPSPASPSPMSPPASPDKNFCFDGSELGRSPALIPLSKEDFHKNDISKSDSDVNENIDRKIDVPMNSNLHVSHSEAMSEQKPNKQESSLSQFPRCQRACTPKQSSIQTNSSEHRQVTENHSTCLEEKKINCDTMKQPIISSPEHKDNKLAVSPAKTSVASAWSGILESNATEEIPYRVMMAKKAEAKKAKHVQQETDTGEVNTEVQLIELESQLSRVASNPMMDLSEVVSKLIICAVPNSLLVEHLLQLLKQGSEHTVNHIVLKGKGINSDSEHVFLTCIECAVFKLILAFADRKTTEFRDMLFSKAMSLIRTLGHAPFNHRVLVCHLLCLVCRHYGNAERARVLIFDLIYMRIAQFPQFILAIVSAWPVIVLPDQPSQASRLLARCIAGSVLKLPSHNTKGFKKLERIKDTFCQLSKWPTEEQLSDDDSLADEILSAMEACCLRLKPERTGDGARTLIMHELHELRCALQLMVGYMKWAWANDTLIVGKVWPKLQSWDAKKTELGDEYAVQLITIIGAVTFLCPKEHSAAVKSLVFRISAVLHSSNMPPAVHHACVHSLMVLVPFDPENIAVSLVKYLDQSANILTIPQTLAKDIKLFYEKYQTRLPFLKTCPLK